MRTELDRHLALLWTWQSEVLLGIALRGVPRDSYLLSSKLGRYDLQHFDFSGRRVAESVDVSLHRLGTDHLDICLCHDIEFVDMQQIVDETLPALRKAQQQGKVRFVGLSRLSDEDLSVCPGTCARGCGLKL